MLISAAAVSAVACCDDRAIPKMSHELYSSDASTRNTAALGLARCGDRAKSAVPRLAALLYDPNVGVQSSASYALRKIDTREARRAIEDAMAAKEIRSRQSR